MISQNASSNGHAKLENQQLDTHQPEANQVRKKLEERLAERKLEKDLTLSADDITEPAVDPEAVPSVSVSAARKVRAHSALPQSAGKRAFGIANRMASATTLEGLYQVTVSELRNKFQCDRAIIYRFQSHSEGTVIAEAIATGYTPHHQPNARRHYLRG